MILLNFKKNFSKKSSLAFLILASMMGSIIFFGMLLSHYEVYSKGKEALPISAITLSYSSFCNFILIIGFSLINSYSFFECEKDRFFSFLKSSQVSLMKFIYQLLVSNLLYMFVLLISIYAPLLLLNYIFGKSLFLESSILALIFSSVSFGFASVLFSYAFRRSFGLAFLANFILLNCLYFMNKFVPFLSNFALKDLFDYLSLSFHFTQIQRGEIYSYHGVYLLSIVIISYLSLYFLSFYREERS